MKELYRAFVVADDAWSSALVKRFGKRAGDVRYTSQGSTGEFAGLYRAFQVAGCAWRNAPGSSFTKGCTWGEHGRLGYEADLKRTPRYHDGGLRPTWGQLSEIAQWSWNRGLSTTDAGPGTIDAGALARVLLSKGVI